MREHQLLGCGREENVVQERVEIFQAEIDAKSCALEHLRDRPCQIIVGPRICHAEHKSGLSRTKAGFLKELARRLRVVKVGSVPPQVRIGLRKGPKHARAEGFTGGRHEVAGSVFVDWTLAPLGLLWQTCGRAPDLL